MQQILDCFKLSRFLLLSTLLFFIGCNGSQTKIDRASSMIESFENDKAEISSEGWVELENLMLELENDITSNKFDFSEDQMSEVKRLQGRYGAILVKKGIDDFKEALKDLGNQMEGFIEGIKSDTNN